MGFESAEERLRDRGFLKLALEKMKRRDFSSDTIATLKKAAVEQKHLDLLDLLDSLERVLQVEKSGGHDAGGNTASGLEKDIQKKLEELGWGE